MMYKEILLNMDVGVGLCKILYDQKGEPSDFKFTDINPAFAKIVGIKQEEIIGKNASENICCQDEMMLANFKEAVLMKNKVSFYRYIEALDKYTKVEAIPKKQEICILLSDITKYKKTEQQLSRYLCLYQHTHEIILFIDLDGNIIDANKAAVNIYGYTHDELTSMKIFDLRYTENKEYIKNQMDIANLEGINFETEHIKKDGTKLSVEVSSTGTMIDNKPVLLSIIRDITEQKANREKITRLAFYDTLTNLPNRRFFKEKLAEALYSAKKNDNEAAIMFLDIDGFKHVNDTYGHNIGDVLLVEVAKRIEQKIPKNAFVARLGGDEFVILQSVVFDENDVVKIAQDINNEINKSFTINGVDINVSTSIGISLYPVDGVTSEELMRKADIAMYEAKKAYGNDYRFAQQIGK